MPHQFFLLSFLFFLSQVVPSPLVRPCATASMPERGGGLQKDSTFSAQELISNLNVAERVFAVATHLTCNRLQRRYRMI